MSRDVYSCTHWLRPRNPPPPPPSPRIGTRIRGRYCSAKIDDLFVTPCNLLVCRNLNPFKFDKQHLHSLHLATVLTSLRFGRRSRSIVGRWKYPKPICSAWGEVGETLQQEQGWHNSKDVTSNNRNLSNNRTEGKPITTGTSVASRTPGKSTACSKNNINNNWVDSNINDYWNIRKLLSNKLEIYNIKGIDQREKMLVRGNHDAI